MANKTALRELQQRLAERMQAARETTLIANWPAAPDSIFRWTRSAGSNRVDGSLVAW